MTATMTTTDLAAEFETTPRTLRKFLRSDACKIDSVGKGSRYALPTAKREVAALRKSFLAWGDAQVEAKAAREVEKATASDAPEVDEVDSDPTDDDIAAIESE